MAARCVLPSLLLSLACATSPKESSDPTEPGTAGSVALTPATLGAGGVCSAVPEPGTSERRLQSSGAERRFLLHVPSRAPAAGAWPVVLELHGSGGSPEGQMELSALASLSEQAGFLLVAGEAVDRRWNVPPDAARASDVQYVSDVLALLEREACIDPARFYATGFSGGGRMVSQLACDLAPRVAAIAAIGGIRFPEPCSSTRPVPILAFHGTADETNPYAGGGQPYWGTGVDAAIDGWMQHDGCTSRSEETAAEVTRISHAGAGCTDVVLYRIEGFGHSWPSHVVFAFASGSAGAAAATSANEILWSFFEQHPLPSASP